MTVRGAVLIILAVLFAAWPATTSAQTAPAPIIIGQSYRLPSAIMGEAREINVWLPPGYGETDQTYPVLVVLDGGVGQDFHHISGLAQLGTVNGTTRDVIVVGIASVDRRRELALPSDDPDLIAAYPTQGHSQQFRDHLWREVLPWIDANFSTDGHRTLMGESLGGLFVVETFLKAPELFDAYVAVSPSLWWDGGRLARQSGAHLRDHSNEPRTLLLYLGDEGELMEAPMAVLLHALAGHAMPGLVWTYRPRPADTHATIYHGAALDAFRSLYSYPTEDE